MRTDSYSSLDFTYWILENVEEDYMDADTGAVFHPALNSTVMQGVIVDAAQICGITLPRTFSALMATVDRYKTAITAEEALRMRGAILYKGQCLSVSVGDRERAVGANLDESVSLYKLGEAERVAEYWDGGFKLPEMRYL